MWGLEVSEPSGTLVVTVPLPLPTDEKGLQVDCVKAASISRASTRSSSMALTGCVLGPCRKEELLAGGESWAILWNAGDCRTYP